MTRWKRGAATVGLAAVTIGTTAFVASAQQANHAPTYTGCLNTNSGALTRLAEGASPTAPCRGPQTEIRIGSGDITAVIAGAGLLGGGDQGDLTLSVPQGSGSGLNADAVDGLDSTAFVPADRLVTVTATGTQQFVFQRGQTHTVLDMRCPDDGVAIRGEVDRHNQHFVVDEQYGRSTYTVNVRNDASAMQIAGFDGALTCLVAPRPAVP